MSDGTATKRLIHPASEARTLYPPRRVDPVSEIETALGAELLRCGMLHREPPKVAGRYIVQKVLGRGASGLVVAAHDERLNRSVALKLRPAQGDTAMLSEARTLARLDHPNVVRVHDVEVVLASLDGREFKLWLVSMERVDGRTMRAWLHERRRNPGEILAVCVDVGRGLAAAHEAHIVHRDVKPDNVIVRADGVAQILDFGFAVQATSTQSDVGGLRPAAGTDPYMSPEARLGRTTRKSDQYSLGITLVEALTRSPVPAGRRVPSGVRRQVWVIAQRATAPDPPDRYPDMKTMVAELARVAHGSSSARTASIVAVPVISIFALALGALAVWTLWPPSSELTSPRGAAGLAGTHEAADARADASVEALVDAGGGPRSGAGSLPDAGESRDAGRCRLPVGGPRTFQTVRTHGGAPARAARGTYTLGLEVRRRELRGVSLARTHPGRDTLDVRSFDFAGGCELHLIALAENRQYEFWLGIDGDRVTGRFEATRDPAQPDFGGVVEPAIEP